MERARSKRRIDDSDEESEHTAEISSTTNESLEKEKNEDEEQENNEDENEDEEIREDEYEDPIENVLESANEETTSNNEESNNIEGDSLIAISISKNENVQPPSTPDKSVVKQEEIEMINLKDGPVEVIGIETSSSQAKAKLEEPPKENLPRLVIDKLVLTNFKSYAGEQVIGPFHSSFSAVVGPNGSGKSNVIDSMLFVFGFRASKMRQGKLSELIHNSEGSKSLDFCSVDIHFHHVIDNDDDSGTSELVANSELVVSRKAFRNNSSQYYINGKSSSYTEVTSLLKHKGIDLDHKRFLILQGEVESIAQMKPKAERENDDGLLEYLEDIIGTTEYKALIETGLIRIEELNNICLEKENRFELVEKDKESLEEKKTDALNFLEKERQLVTKQSISYQVSISHDKAILSKNGKILDDLKQKLEKERGETTEFRKEITLMKNSHKELSKVIEQLDIHIKTLTKKQKQLEKEKVSIEEKQKNLDNRKRKSEKSLQTSNQQINEATSKLDSLNQENSGFKTELSELLDSLTAEKEKLEAIRIELQDKTSEFTKQISKYQQDLEPWTDKIEEKKSQINIAESQVNMLKERRMKLDKDIEAAQKRIEDIGVSGKEMEKTVIGLKREQAHVLKQIELGTDECGHAQKKLNEMKSILSNLRQKTYDSSNSLSTSQNKSKILTGLMRLQQSGRIQGFYGRLGDLGVIDDKYDIAISTACPALDDMVVETVETAQQCIEYLRKNNSGYANFICLTKLRNFDLNPIQTPRNVPRLFDLVQPKDRKFLAAFYSRLQDTLVADNLKEANQVAYGQKRWRVVTLDGKLIDKSGTLSGGGNYIAKGGMKSASSGSLISEEEVAELKADLNEKEHKYEVAQNAYREMETQLRTLKDRQPEIELQLNKLNLEIGSLEEEFKNASMNLKILNAEKEKSADSDNDKDVAAAEAKVISLTREQTNLKQQTKDLENKINELQEKIMDVGGVELRLQKSKVDGITQKIEIINDRTKNDRLTIRKLENEIKRHTKSIAESEKEIAQVDKELATINGSIDSIVDSAGQVDAELVEVNDEKEVKLGEIETLKEGLSEREAKIQDLKSAEIELENSIEKYESIVNRASKNVQQNMANIESLEIRDVIPLISWMDEEERSKYVYEDEIRRDLNEEEIDRIDMGKIELEIDELEAYMNNVKVDIDVLEEYGRRKREYEDRKKDLNEAVGERDQVKTQCEELKKKRLDEFMEGFNTISMYLKEMYQMITMGGNAELELVDSLDPFSEGILFSVMPPKKSWRNISNLSGGEKTLSSLALVFALHRFKPTPLYVMDEIDAALDFRNVSIVANYIKERTKNAQFVVISLRNNMFELAKQLVGIYKVNNKTRSITLQNKDFLS